MSYLKNNTVIPSGHFGHLRLRQINSKKWNGMDAKGNFLQTYIHDHGDGVKVLVGTARHNALQMEFTDLEDMYDFLQNRKRRR